MELHDSVVRQTNEWMSEGTWVQPDLRTAIEFMVTEAGEALDAMIRLGAEPFWRTHPSNASTAHLRREIAQTVIMASVALELMGHELDATVTDTLIEMDLERKGDGTV